MRNNKITLSLSPLALLTLAACGGGTTSGSGSGSGTPTPTFSASSGKVEDGPLQNAIAFLDYNDNGILDAGEPSERTGVDGSYSLTPTQAVYSIVAVTDDTTIDTVSGAVVSGVTLKAPSGSSMVTPTTTLMEDGGLTAEQVVQVLGLPEGMNPLTFSAHAVGVDPDKALAVELANQQILSVVNSFAATAEGSGVSEAAAFSAALMSVAEVIKDKSNVYEAAVLAKAADDSLAIPVLSKLILSDSTSLAFVHTKIVGKVNDLAAAEVTAGLTSNIKKSEFAATMVETVKAAVVVNTKILTITDTDLTSAATKDILAISQVFKDQVHAAAELTVANNAGNAVGVAVTPASVAFASTDPTALTNAIANKAPTGMDLDVQTISEASGTLLKVGDVTTTDAAAADGTVSTGFKYSISTVDGTDHAAFMIDASTGALSLIAAANYEEQSSYKVVVTTTDAGGKKYSEELTISVTNIDDGPTTGTVTVTGSATSGGTLTATHSLTDPDGLTAAVGYQWMVNGVAISGATESTYTLNASHIDAKISVNITVSDNMGVETVQSSGLTRVTSNSYDILPDHIGSSFYVWWGGDWTYEEAVADAVVRGGKLASITSAEEQLDLEYVIQLVSDDPFFPSAGSSAPDGGGVAYSWLGANDVAIEGSFVWETGEAFDYQNFGQAEPDNFSGNQNGLAIGYENWPDGASNSDANGSQGQWNDVSTDNKLSYVIEYEPAKPVDAVMVLSFNYENYKKEDVLSKEIDAVSSTLDSGVTAMLNRISDDGEDLVYQAQMNDYTNYLLNDGYTPTATSSALMLTDNITGYKLTAAFANFAPNSIADWTTAFDSFDLADSSTWVISGGLSSLTLSDETGQGIWAITHKADSAKDSVTLTDLQANNGVINALKFEGSNLSNQWNDFVGLLADLETASNAAGATDKSVLSALQDATSGKYALDKISVMAEGVSAPAASLEFKPGGIALSLAEFSMELTAIGSSSTTTFDTDAFLNLVNSDSTNSATAAEVSAALNGAVGGRLSFDHATHGKLMDLTIADFVAAETMTDIEHDGRGSGGGRSFGRKDGDNYVISDHGLVLMYFENSNMSMSEFYDLLSPSFLNEAPTVANPIGDVTFDYGNAFFYQFDANVFMDMDLDDTLTYTATSINVGDPADTPTVVAAENFDGATRTFSGDSDSISGTYAVTVTATDIAGASVSDTFNITITPPPAVLGRVTLDGPLDGALVFTDYNGNGTLDTSETSTRTDSNGDYTINPTQVYSSIIAITDAATVNIATGSAVGAGKFLMYGQAGNDVLTGTAGDNIIDGGTGADTITTGNGADHVVLRSGDGGSTLAAADTLTDFSNGTDKFLLAGGLSFSDLTVAADANNTANTVVSITATSEYLMTITNVAFGYINAMDFVTVPEIA